MVHVGSADRRVWASCVVTSETAAFVDGDGEIAVAAAESYPDVADSAVGESAVTAAAAVVVDVVVVVVVVVVEVTSSLEIDQPADTLVLVPAVLVMTVVRAAR